MYDNVRFIDWDVVTAQALPRTLSEEDDIYIGLLACEGYSQRDAMDAINTERREAGLKEVSRMQIRAAHEQTRVAAHPYKPAKEPVRH